MQHMPEWDKLEINIWEEILKHAKILALDLDFIGEDPENPIGGGFLPLGKRVQESISNEVFIIALIKG